jgi:D-alanyl-D-alanine carboxypeptidase/D-alanyl-D-alanine-endopeptidase (penicillin-binding protein 4)
LDTSRNDSLDDHLIVQAAGETSLPIGQTGGDISSGELASSPLLAPVGAPMPANIAHSTSVIQQWLKNQNLQFPELVLENGAGLSHKERISARHIAALLRLAAKSPFYAEMEASLPILGMDGTVKRRLRDSGFAGYAHLKTGSLDGVKSLAGYVQARSGKQWIVVFVVNHPRASLAQPAQDALIAWLQSEH